MTTQGDVAKFLENSGNAQKLNDLVDDIRKTVMDYQVRASEGLIFIASNVCLRFPYNGMSTTPIGYL